jgi:hypothetical protein
VDQQAELLAQRLLDGRGDLGVGGGVEAASRDLGGEPVGFREADGEGDEVLLNLLGRQLVADFVQRLDGLRLHQQLIFRSRRRDRTAHGVVKTDLVSDDGLLDGGEILQGRKENMSPLGAANVLDEAAQLLAEGNQHLVFVLDRLWRLGYTCQMLLLRWGGGGRGEPSRKGMSSSRVRSAPRASAMVESR